MYFIRGKLAVGGEIPGDMITDLIRGDLADLADLADLSRSFTFLFSLLSATGAAYAHGESCRRTEPKGQKEYWQGVVGRVSRSSERNKQKVPGQKVEQRIKSLAKGGVQLGNCVFYF